MATTLVTTAGASNANSYVTKAEADTYIAAMPYTAKSEWAALTEAAAEARLKLAALWLNTLPYRGARACFEQCLEFPRWFRTDDGYPSYEDTYETMADITEAGYTSPTVPQEVKDAQCEIAFLVIHSIVFKATVGGTPEPEVSSFTMGPLSLSFESMIGGSAFSKGNLSVMAITRILLHKWERHVGGGVI